VADVGRYKISRFYGMSSVLCYQAAVENYDCDTRLFIQSVSAGPDSFLLAPSILTNA
jgi:hypothetical protein